MNTDKTGIQLHNKFINFIHLILVSLRGWNELKRRTAQEIEEETRVVGMTNSNKLNWFSLFYDHFIGNRNDAFVVYLAVNFYEEICHWYMYVEISMLLLFERKYSFHMIKKLSLFQIDVSIFQMHFISWQAFESMLASIRFAQWIFIIQDAWMIISFLRMTVTPWTPNKP